jgi:hypothetical protein
MARKSISSTFDALTPDADTLDPNWFSSSIFLSNASPAAPTPPTEVTLPKAAAEHLPDVALNNLPGFITVPTVESALTTSAPLLAGDPADPLNCPRSIVITLPGAPGVTINAKEEGGNLVFTATVNGTATSTGSLGGVFFQFDESKLSGLNVTGSDVASFQIDQTGGDTILNLGNGITMAGAVKTGFDLGIRFAAVSDHSDITTTTFTISRPGEVLHLEALHDPGETSQVGVRVNPGAQAGPSRSAEKLTAFAPFPPTANPDAATTDEDVPVKINVLANDTDANGSPLTIDRISQQPTYGSVTINADGTLTYTPFLDAVIDGTPITTDKDTFQYCVHDALGGEDHATVTVTVIPVAESPFISLSAAPGASASVTDITVTATSEDFGTRTQGSDFIQSLQLSLTGNFLGVTFSDSQGLLDPATNTITTFGQPGTFTDVIHVDTAALNGQNFNLDDLLTITAVAAETELPTATASASKSQPIQIDYSQFSATPDFQAAGSIWTSGPSFTTDFNTFLGLDKSFGPKTLGTIVLGEGATLTGSLSLKAGFEADLHIDSGSFTADIPFNVALNATYNKTTDALEIDETDSAGTGSISTHGPQGKFSLAFILNAMAAASGKIEVAFQTVFSTNTHFTTNKKATLLSFDSGDLSKSVSFDNIKVTFAWPNIDTSGTGTGGTVTSVNTSNPIVDTNIDLLALLLAAFGLPDIFHIGPLDILSLEAGLSASLKQQFDLSVLGLTPTLLVGTTQTPEPVDKPIANVSSLGLNNDGSVPISLMLTPTDPTLQNITSLAGNLHFDVTVLKLDDLPAVFDAPINIPLGSVPLFNPPPFPVAFQPQTEHFNVT